MAYCFNLNYQDHKKSTQIERESTQTIETTSEDLTPDYGRYIQLQGLIHGGTKMFEKMIEDLKSKILEAVERYLKSHEKAPQKRLDLISKVELKEELGIGDKP